MPPRAGVISVLALNRAPVAKVELGIDLLLRPWQRVVDGEAVKRVANESVAAADAGGAAQEPVRQSVEVWECQRRLTGFRPYSVDDLLPPGR